MFTVSGQLEGLPVRGVWISGGWGPDSSPALLRRLAEVPEGQLVPVTPTGPYWPAEERSAQGAVAQALAVLDLSPWPVLEGPGLPPFPQVPEDADA